MFAINLCRQGSDDTHTMPNTTAAYSDLLIALATLIYGLGQFLGLLVIGMQAGQNDNANTPSSCTDGGLN